MYPRPPNTAVPTRVRTGLDLPHDELDDFAEQYPGLSFIPNENTDSVVAGDESEIMVEGSLDAMIQLLRYVYDDNTADVAYHVFELERIP